MSDYPVFTIDKDEDAPMRAFHFAKDLLERIIEAQDLLLMNEIKANTVVINGRKYGMLKDKPGLAPTIIGMKAETRVDMPDDWDFFLQERPPQPQTNADKIRAMTDEELAEFITPVKCVDCRLLDCGVEEEMFNGKRRTCQERVLDWLKQSAEEA